MAIRASLWGSITDSVTVNHLEYFLFGHSIGSINNLRMHCLLICAACHVIFPLGSFATFNTILIGAIFINQEYWKYQQRLVQRENIYSHQQGPHHDLKPHLNIKHHLQDHHQQSPGVSRQVAGLSAKQPQTRVFEQNRQVDMQDRLRKLMEGSSFAMCNQQVQEIKIGIKGLGAAGGERGQINQF